MGEGFKNAYTFSKFHFATSVSGYNFVHVVNLTFFAVYKKKKTFVSIIKTLVNIIKDKSRCKAEQGHNL